jgi:putative membrane protein
MSYSAKHFLFPAAAAAFLLVSSGYAQTLSSADRKFMQDAAKGGMMEVHMGHMAQQQGASDSVKAYGQRLITDHTKGNEELEALAKKKGVSLPADTPSASAPKAIASKSGADFDKAFQKEAIEDHEKDIKEFEKEASSGSDPDVKAWANKTLPTLRAHLDAAKALK